MKHTLAAAALAIAAPAALAQTVQVYGVLDAGVNRVSGLRGGTQYSLVSGIMDGSRLGFTGEEQIAPGWRALFRMEHRLEADTGAGSNRPGSGGQLPDRFSDARLLGLVPALQPAVNAVAAQIGSTVGVNLENRFWDRQIYLGLVTPAGAVLAGRQYTPGYEVAAAFDTTVTQSSLSAGQVGSFPPTIDIRISNAVAYRIVQGAVSAALMYGLDEGSAASGRFAGANAIYRTDAFAVGVAYQTRKNEDGRKSLTTAVLGASARVGPGTLVGQYTDVRDDNPSGLSSITASLTPLTGAATARVVQNAFVQAARQDGRVMHAGYRLPVADRHTLYLAYTLLDDRRGSNADTTSYGAAFSYALSKRTDINLVLAHFDNQNSAQAAPGQAGFVGGVTAGAGVDSNSVALGLRHRF